MNGARTTASCEFHGPSSNSYTDDKLHSQAQVVSLPVVDRPSRPGEPQHALAPAREQARNTPSQAPKSRPFENAAPLPAVTIALDENYRNETALIICKLVLPSLAA